MRLPSVLRPSSRHIVVVPRSKEQTPDVPLRLPNHFCVECGQRFVKCWQCDTRVPILQVRDGFHLGRCDTHGQICFVCPCKQALTRDERTALASQPVDRPKQVTHIPESISTPMDLQRHHERMNQHLRIGMICVLVGFLGGMAFVLFVAAFTRYGARLLGG
jgi:hypothetical protein